MNANQYSIRQNRPNQLLTAGAAMLASTLVLGSVLWLFASDAPVPAADAAVVIQHHAATDHA